MATPIGDPAITEASAWYFQTRFEIARAIVDRAIPRDDIPAGAGGAYRRLRVGPYRVLHEVGGNLITIVRMDRV
jgi:hypothetical protein